MSSDFYIGYETPVPAGARTRVFGTAVSSVAALIAVALILLASQSPLPAASFAFGRSDSFSGVLHLDPYPTLDTGDGLLWLVAPGKRGARELLASLDGQRVALRGALIERGPHRMIEVVPGSALAQGPAGSSARNPREDLGNATLHGEIVDAKCYLGVMNPGEGIVHRDCARACLRGGLPAMFAVTTDTGRVELFVLVNASGGPADPGVARTAGKQVTLTGRVYFDPGSRQLTLKLP